MRPVEGVREGGQSRRSYRSTAPAFHIICLASGGGPSEDNVSGFLVRSTAKNWAKGSVLTIDAGSHLAAITRLLDHHFPNVSHPLLRERTNDEPPTPLTPIQPDLLNYDSWSDSDSLSPEPEAQPFTTLTTGPFAGLPFPHASSRANGIYIVKELISTYLITHPHLDHVSALAINTASFHNTNRPKKVAALTSTVNALKAHIFNQIIWPNLTDEDGGVGFITFQRLIPGGHIQVGEGSGKGYIEVVDGLGVKGMKISHGHCTKGPDPFPKRASEVGLSDVKFPTRNGSISGEMFYEPRRMSMTANASSIPQEQDFAPMHSHDGTSYGREVVVDSTAYFIRDDATRREILFFGDVEPDSLSLSPRTIHVWTEAAPKISSGHLRAILIECSYDDSHADNVLFGHLSPRHLFKELQTLGDMVRVRKAEDAVRRANRRKRKHSMADGSALNSGMSTGTSTPAAEEQQQSFPDYFIGGNKRPRLGYESVGGYKTEAVTPQPRSHPTTSPPLPRPQTANGTGYLDALVAPSEGPLKGVTIIVIHVKDTLKDGPHIGGKILRQLRGHEAALKELDGTGLGCEFVISEKGKDYWF